MIYGAWIRHLVQKGNIVIFPRYQKNLMSPSPKSFVPNVVRGIKDALVELEKPEHVRPLTEHLSYVGHSYGGVIAANIGVHALRYGLPDTDALLLCSPGTGPFKGGLLKSYEAMPEDINLLIMVSDKDRVVGDRIGKRIFKTAKQVKNRNLLRQFAEKREGTKITAGHNECYALDKTFDSGLRNISTKRALRIGKTDALDYYGYWKLFDALLAFTRHGKHQEVAFGDTSPQRSLGNWSDGQALRELEVMLPPIQAVRVGQ